MQRIYDILMKSAALKGLSDQQRQETVDEVVSYVDPRYSALPRKSQENIARALVRFRAIDMVRHEQRKRKALKDLQTRLREVEPSDDPAFRAVAHELRGALIDAMVDILSVQERTALCLRFYESKKLKDIATALHTSISKTHAMIGGALAKLRSKLAEYSDLGDFAFHPAASLDAPEENPPTPGDNGQSTGDRPPGIE